MDHAALRAALDADPATAAMTDADALAWLQAPDPAKTAAKLSLRDLVTALDDLGRLAAIQQAAEAGTPAAVDAVTLLRTMHEYGRETANFNKARHAARMQALVDAGLLSAAERANIEGRATVTTEPRWPGRIVLGDVVAARRI